MIGVLYTMADKKSSTPKRYRNFATVIYPDSAPSDWEQILAACLVPCFVSPLHDRDLNPTGESKKPHYHVLLTFDGAKSLDQAKDIFDKIGGVGCEVVNSVRGYARYLCHLDNPEKAQYATDTVHSYCGADYITTIGLLSDKYKSITEMEEFCDEYNVLSFYVLSKYARRCRPDWHRVLCDCATIYMKEFLRSRRWSIENGYSDVIDPKTGEAL